MEITQEIVKELFDYHEDGWLYYRINVGSRIKKGMKAGALHNKNVRPRYVINIKGKQYFLSRMIFYWHNGYLPAEVDHKDRNPLNNRIGNLRAATRSENAKNKTKKKNVTSKYTGVHLRGKHWIASIRINTRATFLGNFKTEEEAAIAYNEAAKIHHGEFANYNIL